MSAISKSRSEVANLAKRVNESKKRKIDDDSDIAANPTQLFHLHTIVSQMIIRKTNAKKLKCF